LSHHFARTFRNLLWIALATMNQAAAKSWLLGLACHKGSADAIRGHDPISARATNRLRDVLLSARIALKTLWTRTSQLIFYQRNQSSSAEGGLPAIAVGLSGRAWFCPEAYLAQWTQKWPLARFQLQAPDV
jgi:hypothetical protein